jgi:hypothetical protein
MAEIRIVSTADIDRCPRHSLLPSHYRDDGSCQCLELLRTYASGPRIWDAAEILARVHDLADWGLIELVPGRDGAYQLTQKGREAIS